MMMQDILEQIIKKVVVVDVIEEHLMLEMIVMMKEIIKTMIKILAVVNVIQKGTMMMTMFIKIMQNLIH